VTLRYQDGTIEEMHKGLAVPDTWRDALKAAAERWPGVLVEPKPHGVAVHYRLVPERGNDVWRLVRALVPQDHPWFHLIPAREAVEIGPRAASKGHAVERLMAQAPFHGRRPIFVGDDFTDEAGMEAARQFGGEGLRVAEVFGGNPAEVRAWLSRGAELLGNRAASLRPVGVSP
jgi:trehalose 6-phosphate phosphatase